MFAIVHAVSLFSVVVYKKAKRKYLFGAITSEKYLPFCVGAGGFNVWHNKGDEFH